MESYEKLINDVIIWAYDRNIILGTTDKDQTLKAVAEMGELADAINKDDQEGIEDGIGDVLVCLINIAEQRETTLRLCLEAAYNQIKDRKGVIHNGVFIKESDPLYSTILWRYDEEV